MEELRLRAKEKELLGCSIFGDSLTAAASLSPLAMALLCMPGKGNMGLNRLLDMRLDIGIEEGGKQDQAEQPLYYSERRKTLLSPRGHLVPNKVVEWRMGKGLFQLVVQSKEMHLQGCLQAAWKPHTQLGVCNRKATVRYWSRVAL